MYVLVCRFCAVFCCILLLRVGTEQIVGHHKTEGVKKVEVNISQ